MSSAHGNYETFSSFKILAKSVMLQNDKRF